MTYDPYDDPRNQNTPEPVRLTPGRLIGLSFRIAKTYGYSVLACMIYARYCASTGQRSTICEKAVKRAQEFGLRPFDPTYGAQVSDTYLKRKALSYRDRLEREAHDRVFRGERFGRKQAS